MVRMALTEHCIYVQILLGKQRQNGQLRLLNWRKGRGDTTYDRQSIAIMFSRRYNVSRGSIITILIIKS